jgi:hypothetical protein
MNENQELVQQNGSTPVAWTTSIRNDKERTANCVTSLVNVMKIDFGHKFMSRFPTDEDLRLYKRRLYIKLRDIDLSLVSDAYELFIGSTPTPEWTPDIPQLFEKIKQVEQDRRKAERNRVEADAVALFPPPSTVKIDPVAMFAEAKAKKNVPMTHDEWVANKNELFKNHEAVLVIYGMRIRKPQHGHRNCVVVGCRGAGTISGGTRGDDNFYCLDHWKVA